MQQALEQTGIVDDADRREHPRRRRHDRLGALHRRRARQRRRAARVRAHHARRHRDLRFAGHARRRRRRSRASPANTKRSPCRRPRRSARSTTCSPRSRADPESISWGGGSVGGSDQILAGLIAAAVGVEPRRVNYIGFSGGGEALAAVLGGQVSVGINGLAEFAAQIDAGTLRVLAVSSAERLPGVDAPTLARARRRRRVRELALRRRAARASRPRSAHGSAPRSMRWSARPNGASCSRAIAGSIAISPATSSRRSRPLRNGACARSCASSAPAPARARARLYPVFVLAGLARARRRGARRAPARAPRATRTPRARTGARSPSSAPAQRCTCCSPRARASSSPPRCSSGSSRARSTRDTRCATPRGRSRVAVASFALFDYALELPLPAGVLGDWL